MELSSIYGINTDAVNTLKNVSLDKTEEGNDMFASLLNTAIDNINSTNALLSNAENEEIKFALGETTNPHDLTIALQKASTALQYTIAVRDKFLEAYKEIMNMQI
ncbi:MAG: flagellar hook-basal body complex protein FliE [Lachnospiraceae bacterium]|nr:flagellar hook-basal body complex protein FliE [Lachnospiraceae bacterium]